MQVKKVENKIFVLLTIALVCGCFDYDRSINIDHVNIYADLNTPEQSKNVVMQNFVTTTTLRYPILFNSTNEWFKNNDLYSSYLSLDACEKLQMQGYAVACIYENDTLWKQLK